VAAIIAKPPPQSMMPADFAQRMTNQEIDALAAWVLRAARRPAATSR
jgi:hypothetical protein